MEIPTARVLDDGEFRIGAAQAWPYRWFTGAMGVFPGLEFSGRLTEIRNIASGLGEDYGANKDKAFDLKYQLFAETKYYPALALGLHDFHGTKQFTSQYLVLSRQYYPLDFTLGLGRGRLHGPISAPLSDEFGLFGGIEWALSERLHLMAEYNPIEYEQDKQSVRGVPAGADSPVNIGLRFKPTPGLNLGLSYQRGQTLGVMVHIQTTLGERMLPQRADPPHQVPVDQRPFKERDPKEMVARIHATIKEDGFRDVSVYTDGQNLIAEFQNTQYLSNQKAAGRVFRILLFHAPQETKELSIILKERNLPLLKITVQPEHLEKYLFGDMPDETFAKLARIETPGRTPQKDPDQSVRKKDRSLNYDYGIKPDMETYLNDPSGFFKGRLGVKPFINVNVWPGARVQARYDIPLYSSIASSNEPVQDAVKSDSWKYLDRNYSFDLLMFDQVVRLSDRDFGRVSVGYFDKMYAGVAAELLRFGGDGRWAVGLEGEWVKKREIRSQFGLMDFEKHTLLANFYYYFQNQHLVFNAKYGRFLAGDVGWRFDVSREYATGAILGLYYSVTDTNDFSEYNRDYHDKGIYLKLPIRIFLTHDSPLSYNYAISPWTRDVGATVGHGESLFEQGYKLRPIVFQSDLKKLKE